MDINVIHRLLREEGGGSNKILLLGRSVTFDTASTYIKDPAMKHILADDYFALLHPAGDSLVPPLRCYYQLLIGFPGAPSLPSLRTVFL